MRTITLTCAILLLASCGRSPEAQQSPGPKPAAAVRPGTSDDSSPIIISDGSIHIKHGKPKRDHFTDKNPKKREEIKAAHYRPNAFGYKCDPAPGATGACPATTCDASPLQAAAPCRVDVNTAKSWTLWLCENTGTCTSPGTVDVTWPEPGTPPDSEKMTIISHAKDFTYTPPSAGAGAELAHTSTDQDHLQGATLEVTPPAGASTKYLFVCEPKKGKECLRIDYHR